FHDNAETGFNSFSISSTAHVQEVSRFTTRQLNHIHGSHSKTGTVHHAAYVAVQLHVVQVVLSSLHFSWVFFILVTHIGQVRVAHQRVIIQAHFAVNSYYLVVCRFEQRVDLQHSAIQLYISVV